MTSMNQIKGFLRDNVWILVAAFFFIAWKFFLIYTLWDDRLVPPVPDDSYVYALHLDATINCSNLLSCSDRAINFSTYAGFDHLAYRLFIGVPAKFLSLDPLRAYQASFYFGIVILAITLFLFIRSITDKKNYALVAFSIFILTLYNGAGSFHGFYWVVPSFFSFVAILITFSAVFDENRRNWPLWISLSVPFGIFSHILGLYLLIVLPLFIFFNFILEAKLPSSVFLKKVFFVFFVASAVYVPVAYYYSQVSYGNPYGPIQAMTPSLLPALNQEKNLSITSFFSHHTTPNQNKLSQLFPGWEKINDNYFRWIFPSWIGYVIFLACIAVLFYSRQYRLLSLYFSALLFSFLASININGERSLILLWPITYLLYGQSAWFTWKLLGNELLPKKIRIVGKCLTLILTLFFILLSLSYSYLWNQYLGNARNVRIEEGVTEYLYQNVSSKEQIIYSEEMKLLDSALFLRYGSNKPRNTASFNEAKYYITLDPNKKLNDDAAYDSTFQRFFDIISKSLLFNRKNDNRKNFSEIPHIDNFSFEKEVSFGDVEIYRIIKSESTNH